MSFIIAILAAASVGGWILAPLRLRGIESIVFRLYVGLSVCALIALTLGTISLRAVVFVYFVLAGAGLVQEILRRVGGKSSSSTSETGAPLQLFERVCFGAILIGLGLAALSALAPNTSWDGAVAHLALPSTYAEAGRIHFVEGNAYTAYPHLLHGLYGAVLVLAGETGLGLLSWTFGAMACGALYVLGARLGGRSTGLFAAAIFATSPIFFDQVGTSGIDVPFAGCTVAALAGLAIWRSEYSRGWLILAAGLAGVSVGMRHTGFVVMAILAVGVLVVARDRRIEWACVFAMVAAFAAYPWCLRNAFLVGNPVYPFLSGVFPTPYLPDMQATAPGTHETVRSLGLFSALSFPWSIVTRPENFDGWSRSPGGLVLILGIPGLIVGGRGARALGGFSAAGLAVFFVFQRFARYLLPFFMPMMVVAALAPLSLGVLKRPARVLASAALAYGLVLGVAAVHFKAAVAFGIDDRDAYLASRVERYGAFEWANRNLDPSLTLFTLDPRTYYLDMPTFQNVAILPFLGTLTPQEQLFWFRSRKIRYLLYPKFYMDQSPALRERGYVDIVNRWRKDEKRFRLMEILSVPRPRSGGAERVEIYEILYDGYPMAGEVDHDAT